jgi:hypothetical protein
MEREGMERERMNRERTERTWPWSWAGSWFSFHNDLGIPTLAAFKEQVSEDLLSGNCCSNHSQRVYQPSAVLISHNLQILAWI